MSYLIHPFFRLHGSYEALKYGTTLDGLSDLTGGIAENIPLKAESTGARELIANLLQMTTVVMVKVARESNDSSSNKSSNDQNKVSNIRCWCCSAVGNEAIEMHLCRYAANINLFTSTSKVTCCNIIPTEDQTVAFFCVVFLELLRIYKFICE